MNVTFLTPSVSRALGGIFEIERELAQAIVETNGANVEVIGLEDHLTQEDADLWHPLQPKILPVRGPKAFGFNPGLVPKLIESQADLVHLHSLWMYTSVAALRWHMLTGKPHVITIHGMLDPWARNNSWWKKRLAALLYEDANIRKASCLQVNSQAEYQAVRDYGVDTPICVIPNGVRLPEHRTQTEKGSEQSPFADEIAPGQHILLFLGRLHPKKGLTNLIKAWAIIESYGSTLAAEQWSLAIVGWDDGGHMTNLERQIEEAGLQRVHMLGPLFDAEKEAAFQYADAFILPSFSEGLPMAVLEAWSHCLPVLKTRACNLPIGFVQEAAIEVSTEPEQLAEKLQLLFSMSLEECEAMGQRGRALVERRFTWQKVAHQMIDVYRWVRNEAPMPDTVYVD